MNSAPPIVDFFARSESILEQKLCACLLFNPAEVIMKCEGFTPEVNIQAKRFWKQVQDRKRKILESSVDDQIEICHSLLIKDYPKLVYRYWDLLEVENCHLAVDPTLAYLKDLRTVRKSLNSLKKHRTIKHYMGSEKK